MAYAASQTTSLHKRLNKTESPIFVLFFRLTKAAFYLSSKAIENGSG